MFSLLTVGGAIMHLLKEYKIFISKVKKGAETSDQSIAYALCSLSKKNTHNHLSILYKMLLFFK